jgi:hypothetical protein
VAEPRSCATLGSYFAARSLRNRAAQKPGRVVGQAVRFHSVFVVHGFVHGADGGGELGAISPV